MAENTKTAFPQTPDGVTDWEQVFESPSGLITLVGQARTAAAIRECVLVIISQLFTRKQDQLEVARLTHQLDSLVVRFGGSGDIDGLSQAVIDQLRQIKITRIQKAQDYLANKQKKHRKNRRTTTFGTLLSANTYRLINDPKIAIIAGGGTFIVLIVILGIIINIYTDGKLTRALGFGGDGQPNPPIEQAESPEASKDPEDTEKPVDTEPDTEVPTLKKPEIKDQAPEMPPAIVLGRVILPRISGTPKKNYGQVLPILVLANPQDLSSVCRIKPIVLDALNIQFGKFQDRKNSLTDTDLANVSIEVIKRLNARLGRKAIVRMLLVRGADHRDRASKLCQQASDKFLKYLTE